jgi:hypothetical protein
MPPTVAAVALLPVVSTPTDSDDLPDLDPEQYQALKEDIRQRGVQVAIEVCAKSGEILDGRVRVRICEELKIRHYPRRVVAGLDTEEARRYHRLKVNLLRRQLDRATIKGLALAEMRRSPRSDRFLASLLGVSHPTIGKWRRELTLTGKCLPVDEFTSSNGKTFRRPTSMYASTASSASRAARLLDEIGEDGPGRTMTPLQAGRLAVRVRRERADTSTVRPTAKVKLYGGRFQEAAAKIKSGSVDVLFTDPPYDRAWLDDGQWADLATLAARVLKPGGVLVAYAGIAFLPQVMAACTTLLVARLLGLKAIGIDSDLKAIALINERLEASG